MALTRGKYAAIRVLAAKLATDSGVPSTPDATNATFKVFNCSLDPDDVTIERELQAALGTEKAEPGPKSGRLSFEVDLCAPVAALPAWGVCLKGCDMTETSGTYAFASGTDELTFRYDEDGLSTVFYGARGNFTILLPTGGIPKIRFEFMGKYLDAKTDTAILAPTYESALAPIFAGGSNTATIGSYQLHTSNIELTPGNQVIMRQTANDPHTDSSGFINAAIVNRNAGGSMDPEASAVATRNWRSIRALKTSETLTVNLGTVAASNRATIASTTFQTTGVGRTNREGMLADNIAFKLTGATPFSLDFPDVA